MNYIPNSSARLLKRQQNDFVGIVMPSISDPYYVQILQGAENALREFNYDVNISITHENPDLETEILRNILSKRGAGIILVSCQPENSVLFKGLNIPIIQIDRKLSGGFPGYLSFDYRKRVKEVTSEYLASKNDVAILVGPKGYSCEDEAITGYMEAFDQFDMSVDPHLISRTVLSKETAFFALLEMFKTKKPNAPYYNSSKLCRRHQRWPDDSRFENT